jgi:hypothetical protein
MPSRQFAAPRSTTIAAALALAFAAGLLAGCHKAGPGGPADAASAPATALLISPEDVRTVGLQAHATGPVITGLDRRFGNTGPECAQYPNKWANYQAGGDPPPQTDPRQSNLGAPS